MTAGAPDNHIAQPAQIVFHGAELRQAVERPHHKKSVAQPTITIVPVARAARRFRYAGGHGGDNCTGVFAQGQFQGNCGTNHSGLPLQRCGQCAAPVAPVRQGFLFKGSCGVADAIEQGFIRPQYEIVWPADHECGFGQQIIDGGIGIQAQGLFRSYITQVIAAACDHRYFTPPVETRAQ